MAKTQGPTMVLVEQVSQESIIIRVVGETGLYCHRLATKARNQLLLGGRKKTAADKLELKHDPPTEFRESMMLRPGKFPDTDIVFPSMAFKSAMATAALVVSGIKKTDVQRLVYFPSDIVPIYGVPKLRMDVVRSADINRTPDVRTRAFLENWASEFEVRFATPALTAVAISTLVHNAGMVAGVGDFRQEKGKGSYGTFKCETTIPDALRDRDAQREAINSPEPYDEDTWELFDMFVEERTRRS